MKYIITLIILITSISLFAQDKLLFSELYEFQDDKIKVYLDGVYKVKEKSCADYYMICKINNQLEFTDEVSVYDLKNRIVAKGNFEGSKLNGDFTAFLSNGQVEITGNYDEGVRKGIWKYYYENGQLKKVVDFGEGKHYPLLKEFYKKNGKQNVIDGNGDFDDLISTSIAHQGKYRYKGKVRDGLLDGMWKIEVGGTIAAKEIFDNGRLVEGTSFSVFFGNQKYYDHPVATIFGINFLEYVKIWGPSGCKDEPAELGLSPAFHDDLHKILFPFVREFNDFWYFVEIQADKNGLFSKAFSFPKNQLLTSVITEKLKNNVVKTKWSEPRKGNQVILIFFKDDVYFQQTTRIDNFILNFRY